MANPLIINVHGDYSSTQRLKRVRTVPNHDLKKIVDFYQLNSKQIQEILGISEEAQLDYLDGIKVLELSEMSKRFQEIREQAIELFEDEEKAKRWFLRARKDLQCQTPVEAMITKVGADKVRSILYQAEYGVFG